MNKNPKSGQVVIINTLFFLTVSMAVIGGLARPVVANYAASKAFTQSKHAFLLANSATEEALYRLKSSVALAASETLVLENGTATISVADTADGKRVTVDSNASSYERDVVLDLIQGVGVSFSYGLQSGKGGFQMSGGAGIRGNVYSNGDIIGDGGPFITGSASVSNASNPTAHQSNGGDVPPPYDIDFGGQMSSSDLKPEDVAQSFKVATTAPVTSIRINIRKLNDQWMNNATMRITNDASGKPGQTTIASASLSAAQVTSSFNYLSIPFSSNPVLTPGTTYWIVIDGVNTWNTYYSVSASLNTYASGTAKTGTWNSSNGGTWSNTSPAGLDMYFDIYVGGDTGKISGITIGSGGTGNAWAYEVSNSTVAGTIYCQASVNNNKPCDTTRPDPVEQPFPVSDGNIEEWKAQALAGGTMTGNLNYGSDQVVSLGPKKIVGNLYVGGGATLNVTGTLWVTGTVTVDGGAVIKLAAGYLGTSGIIVTDGRVTALGGGQFKGSGSTGSYILVVTTSTCPTGCAAGTYAVSVSGGTGAVVLNAQKGTIYFTGGAQAKQATAYKIVMDGGTTVNYETGLADINFSGGPSGSWNIVNWEEI